MKTIQYAYHKDDGTIISRVGHEVAWPVLDYGCMRPDNNFSATYHLEKMDNHALRAENWDKLVWTKKFSYEEKNRHRKFWGMAELVPWWVPGQIYIRNDPQYPMLTAHRLATDMPWPTVENAQSFFASVSTFEGFKAITEGWLLSPSTELDLEGSIKSYEGAVRAMKTNHNHGAHPNDLWFSFRTLSCLVVIAKEKKE